MNKKQREGLGKLARQIWVEYEAKLYDFTPDQYIPWEELDERDKEVNRVIGERLWVLGYQEGCVALWNNEVKQFDEPR